MDRCRKATVPELEQGLLATRARNPEMPNPVTASPEVWHAWDKAKRKWLEEVEEISFWLKVRRYEESHPECLLAKSGAKRGRKKNGAEGLFEEPPMPDGLGDDFEGISFAEVS